MGTGQFSLHCRARRRWLLITLTPPTLSTRSRGEVSEPVRPSNPRGSGRPSCSRPTTQQARSRRQPPARNCCSSSSRAPSKQRTTSHPPAPGCGAGVSAGAARPAALHEGRAELVHLGRGQPGRLGGETGQQLLGLQQDPLLVVHCPVNPTSSTNASTPRTGASDPAVAVAWRTMSASTLAWQVRRRDSSGRSPSRGRRSAAAHLSSSCCRSRTRPTVPRRRVQIRR